MTIYIRTKYYDNGRAEARIVSKSGITEQTERFSSHDGFDTYLEEYESLEAFIEELEVELDDVVPLLFALADGEWVDITDYI